ncbi:ABC transporter ATP-binding protein [Flaviflexus salsibiostraticola]|uniref:ABC transporter ATP-binding protein n=1 Tax=Flaviflexus salsibiostraticola TaxID=1282737 RepID=A0A3Q8WVW5_9ACTO|nr:ABC transporter ATP-binding protein [Flaviflexus salsibiostraticola]AZN30384.1 ABC transporter ATP-binding protein [Flaviflexus salsibiostraticola]
MLWKLVRHYAAPYRTWVLAVVILQTATTLATLYLPSLNADIIDNGVAVGDVDHIWRVGGIMLIVALVQLVTAVAAVWFGAKVAMSVGRDMRRAVYSKVDSFSSEEVGRFGAPTLITRSTNDVQQVQMTVLMTLNFMVMVPIMSIGGIIMAVREDPGLSWLVWTSVPVLLTILLILVRMLMPLFQRMQDAIDAINGIMREQIMGIRVVRAYRRERHETARFADANAALTDISVRIGRLFVLMGPIVTLILHLATAAVLWFGGHRVDQGLVDVGALTAFMQYLLQILVAVMMGSFMFMIFPRAIVCAARIGEVLDTESSVREPASPRQPESHAGSVEFRDVTFAYPGAEAPVLADISFTAEPGKTTAIIGSTGSGKSTLINLIPRLYDATEGTVLIDGVPVDELGREHLSGAVGIVPQRPYLFSGSIADNLRFGAPNATEDDMWAALDTAQASDFVRVRSTGSGDSAAKGLESAVSQGGTNVSGGQRQRLCIARALVARPRIYLFDDSFSALDVTTDMKLRAALTDYTEGATVIIVAQRVTTITDADQILVLEEGRIVSRGTHEELLASSPTYQEIVASQISREEIA